YAVQSWTDRDTFYFVNLEAASCTCPHFLHRIRPAQANGEHPAECKHMIQARRKAVRVTARLARQLSVEALRAALAVRSRRPEVQMAIQMVLLEKLHGSTMAE